jgi:peptidoglycan/xylan/chitin deacetylase (PgdA/CDA1 family)
MLAIMRWPHFTRLLVCFWLLIGIGSAQAQGDGTMRRIRVPILMYHYVSPLPPNVDDIRRDLTVLPDVFERQLVYLADEGYETISLYQLYDALMNGAPLPPKPIVLTFDDGYIDHYAYVFPALRRHNMIGTFFIITGRADSDDPAYMSWAQINEMAQAGMSMEPHTKYHRSLSERDRDFLIYEMLGSRESIIAHTKGEGRMLAYPAGEYDANTLQIADEIDFWLAVTTRPGMQQVSTSRLELSRVRVSYNTRVSGLPYLLGGTWLVQGQ